MKPPELDVWILAGQSNMQGCGLLQGALAPDRNVWNFTSAGNWEVACEPLHRLWESVTPVHQNLMRGGMGPAEMALDDAHFAAAENASRVAGSGLGIAFGQAITQATGRPVGLVAAAHGGTSLDQWNFRRRDEGGESLYGAMLQRVRLALESGGALKGLLWYQGESDTGTDEAPSYSARFREWIEAARSDLKMPDLPVIVAQIGRVTNVPGQSDAPWHSLGWETVRQAFLDVEKQLPGVFVTATIDLGLVDSIHIDTPGLIRLGQRMAKLALGHSSPRVVALESLTTPHGLGAARLKCEGVNGGWNPRTHIAGFGVRDDSGNTHPSIYVINASADGDAGFDIHLLLSAPLDETSLVGYGLGLNPYCNATDSADMPLCAFSPIKANQ